MSIPKILYFISGPAPKAEDVEKASQIKAKVVFRNALAVHPESALEDCDGVMGDVPESYSTKFPPFEIAEKDAALRVIAKVAATQEEIAPNSELEKAVKIADTVLKSSVEAEVAPAKKTRKPRAQWKPNVE